MTTWAEMLARGPTLRGGGCCQIDPAAYAGWREAVDCVVVEPEMCVYDLPLPAPLPGWERAHAVIVLSQVFVVSSGPVTWSVHLHSGTDHRGRSIRIPLTLPFQQIGMQTIDIGGTLVRADGDARVVVVGRGPDIWMGKSAVFFGGFR